MIDQAVAGKILVVDDGVDILEIISYNLKTAGYDTVTAKDGSEGYPESKNIQTGSDYAGYHDAEQERD